MDEQTIRDCFRKYYWMFQLFRPRMVRLPGTKRTLILPTWLFVFSPAGIVLAVGAILSIFKGVWLEFAFNPITYVGPFWITMALLAYYWFTVYFPRTLAILYDALEEDAVVKGQFLSRREIIERWGRWIGGVRVIIPVILFSLAIMVLSYPFVGLLWNKTPVPVVFPAGLQNIETSIIQFINHGLPRIEGYTTAIPLLFRSWVESPQA
ncbi:MAG TPA: hypothetical protein VHL11_08950, partial [Phototrophicaceae bacterium]|nr:hypothetical protein [Phototrophicaceae bacterium]